MHRLSTLSLLIIAAILTVIAGFLVRIPTFTPLPSARSINTYQDCVSAGYPVLESYPSQCKTPEGRTFVNPAEQQQVQNNLTTLPSPNPASTAPVQPSGGMSTKPQGGCVVGGCSGELCTEASGGPGVSNCIYKPEFACYKAARCERQANGQCGWTQTTELAQCLANPPASNGPTVY